MLIGEHRHMIDSKRRISLPAELRPSLGSTVVITRGIDTCLYMYPVYEWDAISRSVDSKFTTKRDVRDLNRLLFAGAKKISVDSAGRIIIPDYLCKYANLHDKVLFAGVQNRVELWNEDAWNTYMQEVEKRSPDLVEQIYHG